MDDLVEAAAKALVEPLGYPKQAADNWEGVWVGSVTDSPETGSLAYLCRSLARAIIPIVMEEAAKVCEVTPHDWPDGTIPRANVACATAIRSRASEIAG